MTGLMASANRPKTVIKYPPKALFKVRVTRGLGTPAPT